MKKLHLLALAALTAASASAAETQTNSAAPASAPAESVTDAETSAEALAPAETAQPSSGPKVVFENPFAAPASDGGAAEKKISITPRGRLLFDGALYFPDGNGFSDGVCMPDIRLGAKVKYGNWAATIDVGFAYGKVSMKDVYLQYNFNPANYLRVGYFVHQFGLNAATSSSMKPAFVSPTSDDFFAATGRNMGVQYVYDNNDWFVGLSAMAAGASMTQNSNVQGKTSVGAINRTVWRPLHSTGSVAQIGCSFWYQTPLHLRNNVDGKDEVSEGYFAYTAYFPTQVARIGMLNANVRDAKGCFKLSPEWLFAKDRLALEGQFYWMSIARKDIPAYDAKGVYTYLRSILIGKDYGYNSGAAGLATPGPKSLEMVLGYDYTNARDSRSGVFGGISNDFSATFTYYFNKYVEARLRYSYTKVSNSPVVGDRHINLLQARFQIIF